MNAADPALRPHSHASAVGQPVAAPTSGVDVIVPVYNAPADVARCVDSVLRHTAGAYRLILIDDASTDPAIAALFAALAARRLPHVTLLANERNLGFIGTTNRAMVHSRADVVLLNSDTVVTAGWLEALVRCADADPRIGTITPFSNNAEICSYPRFCVDNEWPDGADPEPVRAALAAAAVPTYPDLPTGVGFCFFIRRGLIDEIGPFDPVFGRGYGEENDLCMRAARAGWRNVLCDDAFVLHLGGRSFVGDKAVLGARNMPLLLERHPQYVDLVHGYIAADPLRPIRDAASALARANGGAARGVLHIIHGHGGGTERHVRSLIDASRDCWRHYLAVAVGDRWQVEEHLEDGSLRTFEFVRRADEPWPDFIGAIAATFSIALVHLHHLSMCRDGVVAGLASLDLPYGITIHDLWLACPTITLTGPDGRFCGGETDAATCGRCLAQQPAFATVDVDGWRGGHEALIDRARFVIAPSRWAASMLMRYFPRASVDVIPHAVPGRWASQASMRIDDAPLRAPMALPEDDVPTVAIVGAIGPDKGARRIERFAEVARERGARVRFVVIGYLDVRHDPWQSDDAVLTVHGRYDPADLPALLDHYRVALVAYPSAGPESFSFTLSEIWRTGRAAIVPPFGALAERVSSTGGGFEWTVDEWRDDAAMFARIVAVLADADALDAASQRARSAPQPSVESMSSRTFAHYSAALASARTNEMPRFSNARIRDALGYVEWMPPATPDVEARTMEPTIAAPAASSADAPTPSPPAAPTPPPLAVASPSGDCLAAVARLALRFRPTPLGRLVYRIAPPFIVEALKHRLR